MARGRAARRSVAGAQALVAGRGRQDGARRRSCAARILQPDAPDAEEAAFLASLALAEQPRRDLFALYQGWLDRVAALEAARITGVFAVRRIPPSARRRGAKHSTRTPGCSARSPALRAQAAKEKQLNRRVDLNLEIKRLEADTAPQQPRTL